MRCTRIVPCLAVLAASAGAALAQAPPPAVTLTPAPAVRRIASPRGTASIEVGGKYTAATATAAARYEGGKWIDITYYRPIARGRADLFGSGADYGKKVNANAPVWRAGANVSTRLKTEVPLEIGGKRLEPGEYSLFVDLKENAWTLVVSSQPFQKNYDANDKTGTWGAYGYDPKYDVVRVPMKLEKAPHAAEALVIDFVDVGEKDGKIALWWAKEFATADFKIAS